MRAFQRRSAPTRAARPAIAPVRIDRKCDTCRSESEDELKLQRALDPGATASDHLGELAVAPPAPVGETVEVSEPNDASERDADRMAEQALSGATSARVVSSMGGPPRLQRAAVEPAAAAPGGFIVDDEAAALLPGQMRKGEFLRALREQACAAADRELARAGRDTQGCPYLARWFDYYEQRDARHVERAVRKYAPEAARATSAAGYIPIVSARAAQAARQWAQTGALPELPEGMGAEMMGGGAIGAIGGAIGAIGGAISGALSAIGSLFFKAESGGARGGVDRGALESRLGPGQPLDGGAQARMGAAFGHDFSRVRVHADHNAAQAASGLNARAFTLGNHVAFAAGQYHPGDLVGDALLAHELAHVVQQGAAAPHGDVPLGDDADPLERDADLAAAAAVEDLHINGGPRRGPVQRRGAVLRTGLRLQRCAGRKVPTMPKEEARSVLQHLSTLSSEEDFRREVGVMTQERTEALLNSIAPEDRQAHAALISRIRNERVVSSVEALQGKLYWSGSSGADFKDSYRIKTTNTRPSDDDLADRIAGDDEKTYTNDFALWVRGSDAPTDTSRMNCWEAILYGGWRAGVITKEWIDDVHANAAFAGQVAAGGRNNLPAVQAGVDAYNKTISDALGFPGAAPWKIGDPPPPRGNLVFFNDTRHVAISTGNTVDGKSEVMSLWFLPVSGPGAFYSHLQRTTIEDIIAQRSELIPLYRVDPKVTIKHGPNPWR